MRGEELDRNRDIVAAVSILIAAPETDIEEQRSGTWATVRYARKKGIPVVIVIERRKMTPQQFVNQTAAHADELRALLRTWHPLRRPAVVGDVTITARGAEQACAQARKEIVAKGGADPVAQFNDALAKGDAEAIMRLLSDAWFGVPESRDCWSIRGFKEAVDLLDDPPQMSERYACDRNGGMKGRYLQRQAWICPRCGDENLWNGHNCSDCHRRVCCACFHHDMGCCLSSGGSDVAPTKPQIQTCKEVVYGR